MTEKEFQPANILFLVFGFAILVFAVFLSLNCARLYVWPEYGRFGDAEMRRYAVTVVCAIAVPIAVIVGQMLLRFKRRSRNARLVGWVLSGVAITAMLVPAAFALYSLRPVPKYDPQNYQHLVGQNIRDVRSEIDMKHAVSGSGGAAGKSYEFISLRGMEIVAGSDGRITEVKTGRRD